MNPKMCILFVCANPQWATGWSFVEIEDAFNELIGELKVLDMKAEDGFVKKKKKEKEAKLWFEAEFNVPRLRSEFWKFRQNGKKFRNFGEIFKQWISVSGHTARGLQSSSRV